MECEDCGENFVFCGFDEDKKLLCDNCREKLNKKIKIKEDKR